MAKSTNSPKENIAAMRKLMAERGIAAYIIPATDPHMSEYLPDHWRALFWASGFTGSAGTLVFTADFAGVWTDGRYFLQAEQQLAGSGIELVKLKMQHTPEFIEWLAETLPSGATVGVDGSLISRLWYKMLEDGITPYGLKLDPQADLISPVWENRKPLPENPIYDFPVKFAGATRPEKLAQIREKLLEKRCDFTIISTLDDIAWAFNLRGTDVNFNPIFVSHAVIGMNEAALFISPEKMPAALRSKLSRDDIKVFDYQTITQFLGKIPAGKSVLIDPKRVSQNLPGALQKGVKIFEAINITTWLKATKSAIEAANTRATMTKDGVVLTKFFYWLSQNVGKQKITEISATEKLHELRNQQKDIVGESFSTIAGYREHAALPHYFATPESNSELKPTGLFLLDSGGQYLGGTTDTTRVISLGNITDEEKTDYTLVLKGMIAVCRLRFPDGTKGWQFDAIARYPQWMMGINFGHGTGHGVGYFLCVHEGPQSISFTANATSSMDAPMMPGMITSVEPGIYRTGKHGMRLENLVLCIEDAQTEFGKFLTFEVLTIAPLFTNLVKKSMLTKEELDWLKNYNNLVFKKIGKFLTSEEKAWVRAETKI